MSNPELPFQLPNVTSAEREQIVRQAQIMRNVATEQHILASALVPDSTQKPQLLGEIHEEYAARYNLEPSLWDVSGLLDLFAKTPDPTHQITPGKKSGSGFMLIKRTRLGDESLSLGGRLLDITRPFPRMPVRSLNPVPYRNRSLALTHPGRNRLLVFHALQHSNGPIAGSQIRDADSEKKLSLEVANSTLANLGKLGITTLHPERTPQHRSLQWEQSLIGADIVDRFLDETSHYRRWELGFVLDGLDLLKGMFRASKPGELAGLHAKGAEANGQARMGNAPMLDVALRAALETYSGQVLSTSEIRSLLSPRLRDRLTSTSLKRMISKLGANASCVKPAGRQKTSAPENLWHILL